MKMLHIDSKFTARIDAIEFGYSTDRMTVVRDVFGDNDIVSFVDSKPILALMAPKIPNPFFNRILISSKFSKDRIAEILNGFCASSASPMIDVSPGAMNEECAAFLASKSFMQTNFHPIFARHADDLKTQSSNLLVRVVSSSSELSKFQDLYVRGWETSAGFSDTMKRYIAKWHAMPDWHLLVASDKGTPVSCAVLFVRDGVAYLADATTPKDMRSRGGQSALLAARINLAKELNCEVIFSRADFGSVSHRNMEKIGLSMAYTRAVWTCVI